MKENTHPKYQEVLFIDTATGAKFVCGTTMPTEITDTFEGKEYPAFKIPISSASHPFFTGSQSFVDSEGRVDKFMKRYGARSAKKATAEEVKDEPKAEKKPKAEAKKDEEA